MMRKLLAALLLCIGFAGAAQAYDFTINVNGQTTNSNYDHAAITATWTDSAAHFDFFAQGSDPSTFVRTTGASSGNCNGAPGAPTKCIELKYPAGGLGATPGVGSYGTLGYRMTVDDATLVDLNWDQLVETGFDMHAIGKMPLSLQAWDTTAARWQDLRNNFQCSGSYTSTTCSTGLTQFVIYVQNDATGGHNGCTSQFLGFQILTNQWYHIHQQLDLTDRAHPIFKEWIKRPSDGAEVLRFNCTWTPPGGTVPVHTIHITHDGWNGGAGTNDKPAVDGYILAANIHVSSGTASGGDVTAPSVPTSVYAATAALQPDQATCQVNVTWNASTDDNSVTGYHVKRDASIVFTGNALSYLDTVTCGGTYVYTVNAFDAVPNNSAYSTGSSITMIDTTPPSVPTNLAASVISSSRIDTSWSASTNVFGHPTTYHLRRGGSIICTTTSLTCSNTGLASSTQYSFTVDASDVVPNNSAQSVAVLATTSGGGGDVTAPTVPGNFRVAATGANFISFAWNVSTDDTAVAGYRVTCGGALVATVTDPSYTYSGLISATPYTCSVQAIDAVPNVSAKTSDLVVTTLAGSSIAILVPQALVGHFVTGP